MRPAALLLLMLLLLLQHGRPYIRSAALLLLLMVSPCRRHVSVAIRRGKTRVVAWTDARESVATWAALIV